MITYYQFLKLNNISIRKMSIYTNFTFRSEKYINNNVTSKHINFLQNILTFLIFHKKYQYNNISHFDLKNIGIVCNKFNFTNGKLNDEYKTHLNNLIINIDSYLFDYRYNFISL